MELGPDRYSLLLELFYSRSFHCYALLMNDMLNRPFFVKSFCINELFTTTAERFSQWFEASWLFKTIFKPFHGWLFCQKKCCSKVKITDRTQQLHNTKTEQTCKFFIFLSPPAASQFGTAKLHSIIAGRTARP